MGMGGGGGSPQIIQTPPPPPNPDLDPATIKQLADIAAERYQREIVTPEVEAIGEEQQARIPLEYGVTGFFPQEQQEFAQTATSQIQDLYSQTSVSAELAAQQSMFQAGMANMQALTDAASRRAQLEAANYQAYAQSAPNFAMGFNNLFGPQQQQQLYPTQQSQQAQQAPGVQALGGGLI